MRVSQIAKGLEHAYLHTLYELAGGEAKRSVFYGDVSLELGLTAEDAEQACDYWAERGVVEWTTLGHVALTHLGLKRAERLAARGWSLTPF